MSGLTKQNKYLLGILVGVPTLLIPYIKYTNMQKQQLQQTKLIQQKNAITIEQQLAKLNELQEVLVHKSARFDIKYLPDSQYLTQDCLMEFFKQTHDLFDKQQIRQTYEKSREGRRKIFENIEIQYETYFRFICTFDEEIKYLIQKVQKDFAIFLSIPYEIITQSIQYHMQSNKFRYELQNWTSNIRQIIQNQLPLYDSPVEKQKVPKIIEYKTKILKDNKSFLIKLVKSLRIQTQEEFECLPTFLTCYLNDKIYEKFHVQSEQITSQQSQININLAKLIQQFEQVQSQFIRELYDTIKQDIVYPHQQIQ